MFKSTLKTLEQNVKNVQSCLQRRQNFFSIVDFEHVFVCRVLLDSFIIFFVH